MRCRECGYQLWNLPARRCPECNLVFAPSLYRFAPFRVEFLCPHCSTVYYGSGRYGHVEPVQFQCGCGRRIHMDEMVLRPAEGADTLKICRLRPPPGVKRRRLISSGVGFLLGLLVWATTAERANPGPPLGLPYLGILFIAGFVSSLFADDRAFWVGAGGVYAGQSLGMLALYPPSQPFWLLGQVLLVVLSILPLAGAAFGFGLRRIVLAQRKKS